MKWLIAAGLAACNISGVSPAHAAITLTTPEVQQAALELAQVTNSEAVIIGSSSDDEKVLALVPQLADANADLASLEKQYPGFLVEFAREMIPITNRSWRERLPELWRRQAVLYASTFTAAELAKLKAFYSSPTGQKLISRLQAAMQPKAMVDEAKASPDFKFGAQSVMSDIRAAVPQAVAAMNADDEAELSKLMQSGLLERMREMGPKTQSIAIDWMNESASWEEEATQNAFDAVLKRRKKAARK